MRVITLNINGIRSGARKGFFTWLSEQNADVLCLQETRATIHDLQDAIFAPLGYERYFCEAERKGYSGVAIFTKQKPVSIVRTLGWKLADQEGRYIQINFANGLGIASLYLPSGTSGALRQQVKFDMMAYYQTILEKQLQTKQSLIICGDWNIVHREIDIKNFKSNQQTSGCLPEERAWLDKIVNGMGWVDAFRVVNQEPGQYTWWSHRGRAWDNNVGWRIDYQVVTPDLQQKITSASIYTDQRFSDHAPVIVDYDI